MTSLTSYKQESKQNIQLLLNNALSFIVPTSILPQCIATISTGRSAVIERQGLANGGDFTTRCSVALHRRLFHLGQAKNSSDICINEHNHLQISTRSPILGVLQIQSYPLPSDLATSLINNIPSENISSFLSDIRIHDECIVFTTQRHMLVQRKREMFPCTNCGLFYKGERGIRDHMLVKHQRSYEQSKAAATETRTAVVPYWRTGTESDAQWIQSLEAEANALNAASNLIKDRSLSIGLEAARIGNLIVLKHLIEEKGWDPTLMTDPTTQDRHGSTALMWSCGGGHLEICKYLVDKCQMNPKQSQLRHRSKRTPLHWAARNGHLEVCQWLVNACNVEPDVRTSDGTSAFHYAVMFQHKDICRWLNSENSNIVHGINSYGCNAVQWAALNGSIEMCEMLLNEFQLDFTLLNYNGHSIFHKAAVKGNTDLLKWFLIKGSNGELGMKSKELNVLLQPDKGGCTPSEMARLEGYQDIVDLFDRYEKEMMEL